MYRIRGEEIKVEGQMMEQHHTMVLVDFPGVLHLPVMDLFGVLH